MQSILRIYKDVLVQRGVLGAPQSCDAQAAAQYGCRAAFLDGEATSATHGVSVQGCLGER